MQPTETHIRNNIIAAYSIASFFVNKTLSKLMIFFSCNFQQILILQPITEQIVTETLFPVVEISAKTKSFKKNKKHFFYSCFSFYLGATAIKPDCKNTVATTKDLIHIYVCVCKMGQLSGSFACMNMIY